MRPEVLRVSVSLKLRRTRSGGMYKNEFHTTLSSLQKEEKPVSVLKHTLSSKIKIKYTFLLKGAMFSYLKKKSLLCL